MPLRKRITTWIKFVIPTLRKTAPMLGVVGIVFGGILAVPQNAISQETAETKFGCSVLISSVPPTRECTGGPFDTKEACVASGCLELWCVPYNECVAKNVIAKKVHEERGGMVTFAVGLAVQGLIELLEIVNAALVWVTGQVANLLDAAIGISLAGLSDIRAIHIGWEITRDVANIFFIFILLIIAIATILRYEPYGAKQLLAKLIVVALLINFSLVISFVVVDASNILALAFISEIHPVSDHIAEILQLNKFTQEDTTSKETTEPTPEEQISIGYAAALQKHDRGFTDATTLTTMAYGDTTSAPNAQIAELFFQITILILILSIIFVFVAMSVMLLIRSVALIVLFVLAPLGFLAAILPSTRGMSNQWWQRLLYQSFFFPAMSFMIYLAITYGVQMKDVFASGGSHVINTGILFNYFATVAILLGSLLVARQMGAYGATAAIGLGLAAVRRARGYAGQVSRQTALRYGVGPAGAVAGFIPQQLGRIPYIGAPLRVIAKPFARMQRAGAEVREKQYEDIKKRTTESESANLATLRALTAPGARRAFREAVIDKGQAHILPQGELRQDVQRFKREGDLNKLRKIYAYNPNLAVEGEATPEQQAAAVTRAAQGLSADDIRAKTHASAIRNAMFADAELLTSGSTKLEASAEKFGEELGPALNQAYDRLVDTKRTEAKAALAARGITAPTAAQETQEAEILATYRLDKENKDVLKFGTRNPSMLVTTQGKELQNKIIRAQEEYNKREADRAIEALEAREAARGRAISSITEAERDQARRGARKIEI